MPAAFSEREQAEIRQGLLRAAYRSLAAGSSAKVSIEELARGAGIAKGSFYRFYPSKELLLMEALEGLEEEYRERISAAARGPGPARDRLEAALEAAFAFMETEPAVSALDSSSLSYLARKLPPERLEAHLAADRAAMEALASRWREEGLLGGAGPEELSAAFYAVFFLSSHREELPPGLWEALKSLARRSFAAELSGEGPQGKGGRP